MFILMKCGGKVLRATIGFTYLSHRMVPRIVITSQMQLRTNKSGPSFTSIKTNESNEDTATSSNTSQWSTIYHFPLISWAAAFNKLKIYQAFLTAIGVPVIHALEQAHQLPTDSYYYFGGVGVSGLLTLIISSLFMRNLIGFIYLNESEGKIKFAYVDFWGYRKEATIEINDMLINWEPYNKWQLFWQSNFLPIRLESDRKQKFRLLKKHGHVFDSLKYRSLFGGD